MGLVVVCQAEEEHQVAGKKKNARRPIDWSKWLMASVKILFSKSLTELDNIPKTELRNQTLNEYNRLMEQKKKPKRRKRNGKSN